MKKISKVLSGSSVLGLHKCGGSVVYVWGSSYGYRICKGCHADTRQGQVVEVV